MADLDVQPKKKSSSWLWLLLLLILVLLIVFFARGCNKNNNAAGTSDSTATTGKDTGSAVATITPAGATSPDWTDVDRNAPSVAYGEITNKNITVRGNDNYGIYSLGENILFDEGKSTIRKDAEQNLKEVVASINKRFNGGKLRIYGYTDSLGSKESNKELAQQRAEAVKTWLAANGGFDSSKISINAIGEGAPVATNTTSAGRQQNRRVEIVARKAK